MHYSFSCQFALTLKFANMMLSRTQHHLWEEFTREQIPSDHSQFSWLPQQVAPSEESIRSIPLNIHERPRTIPGNEHFGVLNTQCTQNWVYVPLTSAVEHNRLWPPHRGLEFHRVHPGNHSALPSPCLPDHSSIHHETVRTFRRHTEQGQFGKGIGAKAGAETK